MIVAMVAGLAAGIFLGFALDITYPSAYSFYITMGLLAAMDSVIGAARSHFEGKYDNLTFISGFIVNALLAAALTFVGDVLGIPLYYAAILVFGGRMFNNFASIRHILIERHKAKKAAETAAVPENAEGETDAEAADAVAATGSEIDDAARRAGF